MNHIEHARRLRPIIEQAVQSLEDDVAMKAVELYPEWTADTDYPNLHKVQRNGKLYRSIQAHRSQSGWEPENTAALWEQIDETHSGTVDDPIPYSGNMTLQNGVYYIQDGVVYKCNRDTVNPVHNTLAELVGLFVEVA